jgi:V/A-type H+-transporting ATPase subunit I
LGLAKLSKVTVISPRSEYTEVAKALALFEDFHPVQDGIPNFDPVLQELTVKAVRLFAQADQASKDLDLQLLPGTVDVVFRGVKVPRNSFEASTWEDLLDKAEADLNPIVDEVKAQKALLQKAAKAEADARTALDALQAVSGFSADLGRLSGLSRLKVVLSVVDAGAVDEFRNSVPGAIFLVQPLQDAKCLVLVAAEKADDAKVDKAMKALDIKPVAIPPGLPQNPAEAFRRLTADYEAAKSERSAIEARIEELRKRHATTLLTARELTEVARDMLDEARVSGDLARMATISGYIPASRDEEFRELFGRWMVQVEPAQSPESGGAVPTLLKNPPGLRSFQLVTGQQGTPGRHEVDPTPIVSFVFPIFFGMMFGDLGHGIILTLFALLIRQRGTGNLRQWGNIFLTAGISAMVFGAAFGEFFGALLYKYLPVPPLIDILQHPLGAPAVPDPAGIQTVMIISILIGVAHLTTGLSLDVFEAAKAKEMVEVVVGKIPTLTMYVSGVGYGIAFIGAGFSFNVLKSTAPAPLLGVPNNLLGGASLAVLLGSMLVLFCGRAVAIKTGRLQGESVASALSNGGLEVFERISQFLSNTISYVRLAIMLLVHAVLLLIVNQYFPLSNPVMIAPWVVLNCLIIAFEAFVVYVQDLRLHIYEFFTKFYRGTGTPFRKILPDRARVEIKWR